MLKSMQPVMMLLMPSLALAFSGCSCKGVPFVTCETEYVTDTKTVYVPQKCIPKATFCTEEGSLKAEDISDLLRCIYELRESNKSCN